MMPLVVAVTICMLIIILGVAEYMRLVITAAGIKDAMESACERSIVMNKEKQRARRNVWLAFS